MHHSQDTLAMMVPLPTLEYLRFGIGSPLAKRSKQRVGHGVLSHSTWLSEVCDNAKHTRGVWKDAPRFDITRVTQSHTPGPKSQCSESRIQVGAIGNGAFIHGSIISYPLQLVAFLGWLGTWVLYRILGECFKMIPFAIANGLSGWYGKERMVDRRNTSDLQDVSCVTGREFSKFFKAPSPTQPAK